jgi:hypothetical protein
MKFTRLITAACAATAIFFTACDKKDGGSASSGGAVSEKDALARLKTDMLALKAETESMKPDPANPMGMLAPLKGMLNKIIALKTDGLPADLKAALIEAQAKVTAAKEMFKDVPDVSDMQALNEKLTADPALAAKLQKAMTEDLPKVMQAVGPAMNNVGEVAKKHGLNIE